MTIGELNIPEEVWAKMKVVAPGVTAFKVEKLVYYEVEFEKEGKEIELLIRADGKVLRIEKEIPVSELDSRIVDYLQTNYPDYEITEVEEVFYGGYRLFYEIDLKKNEDSVEVMIQWDGHEIQPGPKRPRI